MSPETHAELIRLVRDEGSSVRSAAEQLGISRTHAGHLLRHAGVRVVAGQRPKPTPECKPVVVQAEKPGVNHNRARKFNIGVSDPIAEYDYQRSLELPLVVACRCGWREEGIARDVLALQAEHKAVCVDVRELVAA